jgi:hypothetical protein
MPRGRVLVIAFASVAVAFAAIAACVGDDPGTGSSSGGTPGPGERFGPCRANDVCNENLRCEDGICLRSDDPSPEASTVTDGGIPPNDAATDALPDVCAAAVPGPLNSPFIAPCGNADNFCRTDGSVPFCCGDAATQDCYSSVGACGSRPIQIRCVAPEHCATDRCCVEVTVTAPAECPPRGSFVRSTCATTCTGADTALCDGAHPCEAGVCRRVTLQRPVADGGTVSFDVGACL